MERLHPDFEKLIQEATDDKTSPDRLTELAKIGQTLARLVAANANANPELLAKLVSSDDREIRRAVAANPNTPTETLWKVGEEFPEEVLDNAVFSLLLLEEPNLVQTIPEGTWVSFLMCSTVPVSFIERTAVRGTEKLKLALTINPQTPKTVLEKLATGRNPWVREAARLHINFPETIPKNLEEAIGDPIKSILSAEICVVEQYWEFLAEIGVIPLVFFEHLANHEKKDIRARAACSSLLSDRLLEKLAEDFDPYMRMTVARNPHAPAKVLDGLAKDKNIGVRLGVAENPSTPAFILEELWRNSGDNLICEAVLTNPNAPATVFEELAKEMKIGVGYRTGFDPSTSVDLDGGLIWAVALNAKAPGYLLEQIAGYKLERYQQLREQIAINPNTPSFLLEKFALDRETLVREQVARNPNTPTNVLEKFGRYRSDSIREIVARNPNTPTKILEQLAREENYEMHLAIAANPNASSDTLEKLARNEDAEIRVSVASNPSTPARILEELGQDKYSVVRQQVAANPKTPFYLLEKFLSMLIPPGLIIQQKAIKRFLAQKPEGLSVLLELFARELEIFSPSRLFVFSHSQVPPRVLAKHCRSLAWLERCAIAQNPNTPTDALQILAKDGNRIVRAAARDNLSDARVMV